MNLTGRVIRVEAHESFSAREWAIVTFELFFADGELKLRVPRNRADSYKLGRIIRFSGELDPPKRRRQHKMKGAKR